jgi:hypothetical protein
MLFEEIKTKRLNYDASGIVNPYIYSWSKKTNNIYYPISKLTLSDWDKLNILVKMMFQGYEFNQNFVNVELPIMSSWIIDSIDYNQIIKIACQSDIDIQLREFRLQDFEFDK